MNICKLLRPLSKETEQRLVSLWEGSVRATHHFLTEDDVLNIKEMIPTALASIPVLLVATAQDELLGFLGLEEEKVEMLFVDNALRGSGVGKALLKEAIETYGCRFVDVNEDNPKGVGFYQHMGFLEMGRSETDEQGNPFPILHLKRE